VSEPANLDSKVKREKPGCLKLACELKFLEGQPEPSSTLLAKFDPLSVNVTLNATAAILNF
jgi:hypothetical protein